MGPVIEFDILGNGGDALRTWTFGRTLAPQAFQLLGLASAPRSRTPILLRRRLDCQITPTMSPRSRRIVLIAFIVPFGACILLLRHRAGLAASHPLWSIDPSSDRRTLAVLDHIVTPRNTTLSGVVHFDDSVYHRLATSSPPFPLLPPTPHPISILIKQAKHRWESRVAAQSTSLLQAKAEYRRRHGRHPPKGFDEWYTWARSKGVKMLDEYDSIYRAVEPYFALPPDVFRKRVKALADFSTKWKDVRRGSHLCARWPRKVILHGGRAPSSYRSETADLRSSGPKRLGRPDPSKRQSCSNPSRLSCPTWTSPSPSTTIRVRLGKVFLLGTSH